LVFHSSNINSVQLFIKLPLPLLRKLRFPENRIRETTDELGCVALLNTNPRPIERPRQVHTSL